MSLWWSLSSSGGDGDKDCDSSSPASLCRCVACCVVVDGLSELQSSFPSWRPRLSACCDSDYLVGAALCLKLCHEYTANISEVTFSPMMFASA